MNMKKGLILTTALFFWGMITFMILFIYKANDLSDMTDLAAFISEAYTQWQDTTLCMLEELVWDGRNCDDKRETYKEYSTTMYEIGIGEYNFD